MLISNLPGEIRALAMQRRKGYGPTNPNQDRLSRAFLWENTPEGYEFWSYHNGPTFYENDEGEEEIEDQIIKRTT